MENGSVVGTAFLLLPSALKRAVDHHLVKQERPNRNRAKGRKAVCERIRVVYGKTDSIFHSNEL